MLRHDLDVRLERAATSTVYLPYVLDPASPADPATTGDNIRDNVEQIYLATPAPGNYRITVSHKGILTAGRAYSLVASQAMTIERPDLTPPEVLLVRPNGGETFYPETQDTVKWIAADSAGVDSINIYYSVDGGNTFPYTIATGEPNDSAYVWTIPSTLSDSCRVRVVAYDAFFNEGADTSDADFAIAVPPDTTLPEVTVVAPNGGETFFVAAEDTIRWVATDNVGVDSVNIYYSVDGGSTYPYTVATGEYNDSTYAWTVPPTLSDSCLVKVIAFDAALNSAADSSDGVFTIDDVTPPEVAVIRPNGGEIFYAAREDTIRWVATDESGVDSVSIYYSSDGGFSFPHVIATGEPNDSLYVWMVPDTTSDSCIVKVAAYDAALNLAEDSSDGLFSIETPVAVEPEATPGAEVFGLEQNYPNPFNPLTQVEFNLDKSSHVSLDVYDISGQLVRRLVHEPLPSGKHGALWNGEDEGGRPVASGVYVLRLEADRLTAVRKSVLLR
jgi:hypothetical protein